jgi:tetratricopeptide (TPR) repeat protein
MDQTHATSYEELLVEGQRALDQLELEHSLTYFTAAQRLQPHSYEANLGVARASSRMRKMDDAFAAAETCIGLQPERSEAYALMGVLHFVADRLDEALSVLQKAMQYAPSDPEPHLTLAQVYTDKKQFDNAQAELDLAREMIHSISAEPQQASLTALAWHVETYLRLNQGQFAEAAECARQAIALEDANRYAASLAYSNLGVIETRARHYGPAIDSLERAFQMNPFFFRAGAVLGRLLIIQRQAGRAAEVLARVVEIMPPENPAFRYSYALALAKTGQRQEALAQYRQSLQEGLKGLEALLARWQIIWLTPAGRYAVIGLALAALMVWLLLAKPSPQALTFMALAVIILVLQNAWGRRRR